MLDFAFSSSIDVCPQVSEFLVRSNVRQFGFFSFQFLVSFTCKLFLQEAFQFLQLVLQFYLQFSILQLT